MCLFESCRVCVVRAPPADINAAQRGRVCLLLNCHMYSTFQSGCAFMLRFAAFSALQRPDFLHSVSCLAACATACTVHTWIVLEYFCAHIDRNYCKTTWPTILEPFVLSFSRTPMPVPFCPSIKTNRASASPLRV